MILVLVGYFLSMCLGGWALSEWIWTESAYASGSDPHPSVLERWLSSAVLALGLTQSINYGLASLGLFSRSPLLIIGASIGGWVLLTRGRTILRALNSQLPRFQNPGWVGASFACLSAWIFYSFFRGHTFFVLVHDGLAYHMPIAEEIARTGTLIKRVGFDPRMTWPPGFELLLSSTLLLTGGDEYSAWVATLSYVAFLLSVATLAWRWWESPLTTLASVLIAAGMPIVVLHSSVHKNDLMMGALSLSLIYFLSCWSTGGKTAHGVLALLSAGLALGTKISGLFLGPGCLAVALIGVWNLRRSDHRLSRREWAVALSFAALSLTLAGPISYVWNWSHFGHAILDEPRNFGWGEFRNIAEFLYIAVARPFSPSPSGLFVPWSETMWFWPVADVYFSSWGILVSLLALALPLVLVQGRRGLGDPNPRRTERLASAFIATLSVALACSLRNDIDGWYYGMIRYGLYLPVIVVAWSLGQLEVAVSSSPRRFWIQQGVLGATLFAFVYNCIDLSIKDMYGPWGAVTALIKHPEKHRTVWNFPYRAASVVDKLAGPEDHIAIDGSVDTWVYPAYGARLSRTVTLLDHGSGPATISDDIDFVVVDRAWSCWFGDPDFHSLGNWEACAGRGTPLPEDLIVFNQLVDDPAFELVYHLPKINQAVFRRKRGDASSSVPTGPSTESGIQGSPD